MPMVKVGGHELYFEDTGGDGAPVVFSHGLLWSARMFAPQIEALRRTYRVIAYDHRGQGRSQPATAPYSIDDLTVDAAELIDTLGVRGCHFVGLSMGGFVGLRLALRRPELLRSLTLIESAADAEPRWNIPKYRAMALIAKVFGFRPLLAPVMRIMFGRRFLDDAARAGERAAQAEQLLALDADQAKLALLAVVERPAVEDELSRITTPTLVVHGAEDRAIMPARAERCARRIPGATWVLLPDAGHTSTIEEPARVTAAISSFFAASGTAARPPTM